MNLTAELEKFSIVSHTQLQWMGLPIQVTIQTDSALGSFPMSIEILPLKIPGGT